jgi:murein peptide amidase A
VPYLDALVAAALLMAMPFGVHAQSASPAGAESEGPSAATATAATVQTIGRSVQGRTIRARLVGDPSAPTKVLVVGCIHGNETAGEAVTRRLRRLTPPAGVALWLVDEFNPDGCSADTRQNAHGVDLNRNFPYRFRRLPRGTYYSGPRALSEPEARAIHTFIRRQRPALSIWYHQHANLVDESGGDPAIERRYARLVGMRFERFDRPPGSITSWQNHTYPDATAFVVELAAGRLSAATTARHARAVLTLAREVS